MIEFELSLKSCRNYALESYIMKKKMYRKEQIAHLEHLTTSSLSLALKPAGNAKTNTSTANWYPRGGGGTP